MSKSAETMQPETMQPENHTRSLLQCGQLTLERIQFDTGQFDNVLFHRFDIACPPQIKRAIEKRKAEFFYGRLAARYATERFGYTGSIAINADRSPQWPNGLHGSISHCEGQAIAVVLPKRDCAGVGIDIEQVAKGGALSALKKMVVNAEELLRLQQYQGIYSEDILLTLIFSAKESFYKAAYPQVQRFFGFEALIFQSLDTDKQQVTFIVVKDLISQFKLELKVVIDFYLSEHDTVMTSLVLASDS